MSFFRYVFGPKLYMEYGPDNLAHKMYEPLWLERFSDQILSTLSLIWSISYYTSPVIITFLYRRGYLITDSISSVFKVTTGIGLIVMISLCMRGLGRSESSAYKRLMKAFELSKSSNTNQEGKRELRKFDFEFKAWQIDYDANAKVDDKKRVRLAVNNKEKRPFRLAALPCHVAAYVAMHTFGIRMIYPGSVKLLQSYMRPMLVAGRAKLIEEERAQRYKVKTLDNNEIDTIFIDNREKGRNGSTLVICSEGNAGFYEIGIMGTPMSMNYSVLGWNHPGFEGSSGQPYPDQDMNAIDGVVKFAIDKLGFPVEEIILYGWSIGGFSSLYAATIYPDVKGVILDATFDDILYLAQPRMPASLVGIVRLAIRDYCNLNNVELLSQYNGPILLIRRSEDEIISEDSHIETNRGNYLVLALLKYRYPNIYKTAQLTRIKNLLSKPLEPRHNTSVDETLSMARLITYASDQGKAYPMNIGEEYTEEERHNMSEFLLIKHFRDYKSTHCTPLPNDYFNIPWDIPIEHGYVFT